MSTEPPRSLLAGLVDDAAVFPPGDAPAPEAWSEHLRLRSGSWGDLLGPLLVSAAGAPAMAAAALAAPPPGSLSPVALTVVARAGTPTAVLEDAVALLRTTPGVRVASVEVAHAPDGGWRRALTLGVPVAVEVGREPAAAAAALDDVAAARRDVAVVAKLRTQPVPGTPAPTPEQLSRFVHAARERDLPFKLTGGLHHAVAGSHPGPSGPEDQHGLLNVLLAAHRLEDGAEPQELALTLARRDAEGLTAEVAGLDEAAARRLRARFVSFGCCGVTDPLGELAGLGLLAPVRDSADTPSTDPHPGDAP